MFILSLQVPVVACVKKKMDLAVDLHMNHNSEGGYFVTKSRKSCFVNYSSFDDARKQRIA